jgi:hypothetical protein
MYLVSHKGLKYDEFDVVIPIRGNTFTVTLLDQSVEIPSLILGGISRWQRRVYDRWQKKTSTLPQCQLGQLELPLQTVWGNSDCIDVLALNCQALVITEGI